ncbi:MAG TPA: phage/plasmid replication protein, II/X family [Pyrinomonadaceae bacterium]|jgi:hypothetical protein
MIDTIAIKNHYPALPLDERFLMGRGWKVSSRSNLLTWVRNGQKGSNLPRLTLTVTPNATVHLRAEVSLPKLMFGNNVRLPDESELSSGLAQIADYVRQESGFAFDAATARVSRVDFTKDFQVGEERVIPIITALSRKTISRHDRTAYNDDSLYFRSRGKTKEICIYSKSHEVIADKSNLQDVIEMSRGLLRVECSFLNAKAVNALAERLKLPNRSVGSLINQSVADAVFAEVEAKLQIASFGDGGDSETTLLNLIALYGSRRAMRLVGFAVFKQTFGQYFFKNNSIGISKDAYYRDAADWRKASVSMALELLE